MTEVDRHISVASPRCLDFTSWGLRGCREGPRPSSGVSGTTRNISLPTLRLAKGVQSEVRHPRCLRSTDLWFQSVR
jgi:hypothetical protein